MPLLAAEAQGTKSGDLKQRCVAILEAAGMLDENSRAREVGNRDPQLGKPDPEQLKGDEMPDDADSPQSTVDAPQCGRGFAHVLRTRLPTLTLDANNKVDSAFRAPQCEDQVCRLDFSQPITGAEL